jgi:hypothetical protein
MHPGSYWPNVSLRCHSEEMDSINKQFVLTRTFFVAKLWALSRQSYISIAVPVTSLRGGVALTPPPPPRPK